MSNEIVAEWKILKEETPSDHDKEGGKGGYLMMLQSVNNIDDTGDDYCILPAIWYSPIHATKQFGWFGLRSTTSKYRSGFFVPEQAGTRPKGFKTVAWIRTIDLLALPIKGHEIIDIPLEKVNNDDLRGLPVIGTKKNA